MSLILTEPGNSIKIFRLPQSGMATRKDNMGTFGKPIESILVWSFIFTHHGLIYLFLHNFILIYAHMKNQGNFKRIKNKIPWF